MTKIDKNEPGFMQQQGDWIYIVERWQLRGGKIENRWSRMPPKVDRSKPLEESGDHRITAREVPKIVRAAAAEYFRNIDANKGDAA